MSLTKSLTIPLFLSTFLISHIHAEIPEFFDARENWPECKSIAEIKDGKTCSPDWAFAIVSTITDRLCIQTGGKTQIELSVQDLLSCCSDCGRCGPGDSMNLLNTMYYWMTTGIVSEDCLPYSDATALNKTIPECPRQCRTQLSYDSDKHLGKIYLYAIGRKEMQTEIMTKGPVITNFLVYDDLLNHTTGVYETARGSNRAGSTYAKILGWGVEGGKPYWLVANSWGTKWGMNGVAKFLRGNDSWVEGFVVAVTPKTSGASSIFLSLFVGVASLSVVGVGWSL